MASCSHTTSLHEQPFAPMSLLAITPHTAKPSGPAPWSCTSMRHSCRPASSNIEGAMNTMLVTDHRDRPQPYCPGRVPAPADHLGRDGRPPPHQLCPARQPDCIACPPWSSRTAITAACERCSQSTMVASFLLHLPSPTSTSILPSHPHPSPTRQHLSGPPAAAQPRAMRTHQQPHTTMIHPDTTSTVKDQDDKGDGGRAGTAGVCKDKYNHEEPRSNISPASS